MNSLSTGPTIAAAIEEYEEKRDAVTVNVQSFADAIKDMEMQATVASTYAENIWIGHQSAPYESTVRDNLLKSAWRHVYKGLRIEQIAPASDRSRFDLAMANPPEFTADNIRATFGDYVMNPRANILRGLAEAFCDLDDSYRSHSRVAMGVKGLPKRAIFTNALKSWNYGYKRLEDTLKALRMYQGLPAPDYYQIAWHIMGETGRRGNYSNENPPEPIQGVTGKTFANGNVHLHFDAPTLLDINRALAEFYGDVLPDAEDENATRAPGTAVAKDLQFYPTPTAVVERMLNNNYFTEGTRILEPSCGDGRILDVLAAKPDKLELVGIEIDARRAAEARAKGHGVIVQNFLDLPPTGDFDAVVMNPPFYGTHWAKHIAHATKFLKPGGRGISILPASARYDHADLLPSGYRWENLPTGSFAESGTNISTGVLEWRA